MIKEDFEQKADAIRAEYKRLINAADAAKDIQKRHNLKVAAKAQVYRMKLLLSANDIKVTNEELFNEYLK